jgi:hypothetical protein
MAATLRSWLKKQPQPHSVRVRTEDDEVKAVKLSEDTRSRWKNAVETIEAMKGVSVECVASDGTILRAMNLRQDEDGDAITEAQDEASKASAKNFRELGGIIDRVGAHMNDAYQRGADAANMGQENLIELVNLLTQQHAMAITNLHNVSVNLANLLIKMGGGEAESQDPNGAMVAQLVGAAAARMMGAAGGGPAPSNGKPGK